MSTTTEQTISTHKFSSGASGPRQENVLTALLVSKHRDILLSPGCGSVNYLGILHEIVGLHERA